jgi:hypothetical protein
VVANKATKPPYPVAVSLTGHIKYTADREKKQAVKNDKPKPRPCRGEGPLRGAALGVVTPRALGKALTGRNWTVARFREYFFRIHGNTKLAGINRGGDRDPWGKETITKRGAVSGREGPLRFSPLAAPQTPG